MFANKINCGYARVAIRTLSRAGITKEDRQEQFQALLALLKGRADGDIVLLIQSIVEISELLYANDDKRNNVTILRLHNLTWLHHELCKDLFPSLHTLSRAKFFGLYLHALSCHACKQYEIMCLRSCNAENEERLFGQERPLQLTGGLETFYLISYCGYRLNSSLRNCLKSSILKAIR